MCFAIIPKDSKEEVEEVPTKVANMLEEFFYIVSNNVPNGFPVTRWIWFREPVFQTRQCTK